jgi:hypothetical protein
VVEYPPSKRQALSSTPSSGKKKKKKKGKDLKKLKLIKLEPLFISLCFSYCNSRSVSTIYSVLLYSESENSHMLLFNHHENYKWHNGI